MIERLAGRLREVDPDLSAEELADVLWIARLLDRPDACPDAGKPDRAEAAPGANGKGAAEHATAGHADPETPVLDGGDLGQGQGRETYSENGDPDVGASQSASMVQAGLYLPGDIERRREPSFPVRAPTLPALPHTLAIARALRPLRLAVPSPQPGRLNEERTATRFAETLIWEPQLDPATERRFDLVLVVDVAPSMVVWRHTADELRLLLERLGAFRDVRIRYLDTGGVGTVLPDVVAGTGERRIVLVVSDCIGPAWQDGRAAALLERWGRSAAVAVVQPLPQRLWRRCAAATERVWLRARGTGTPNAGLSVRMRDRRAAVPPGITVPVLELDRRWLEPWAAMVAGSAREIPGIALFTGRPAAPLPPEPAAQPQADGPSARDRVLRFRASASPKAVELAGYLAAAPLRLPVMRLVQGTMMPGSTPAHLAEVFLGGLLRVDADSDPPDVAYEFHDGVRDVLLGGLRRDEALLVLREVWGTVRDRLGSSLDFPALLAAVRHDPDVLPPDQPFAQVATGVLARLGGTYSEVARRLNEAAHRRAISWSNGTARDAERNGHAQARMAKDRPEGLREGVPPRNPGFHGRAEVMSRVRESLRDGGVTVLLPGAPRGEGKTEVAVELTHAQAHEYDLVWWIPAADVRSVRASLGTLARRLGTPLSDDLGVTVDNVLQALRNGLLDDGRWLLVYDDAGDPAELAPLMPLNHLEPQASAGHVLITSRDRRWSREANAIEVGAFMRAESISLLQRRLPDLPDADADRLAEALGDLPAALAQAAVHIRATGQDVDAYLRLSGSWENPYATALGITLDRLCTLDPDASDLLKLSTYLGGENRGDEAAMRTLDRLELGRLDPETRTLLVPRCVREAVRDSLTPEAAARTRERLPTMFSTPTGLVPSELLGSDERDARAVVVEQVRFLYHSGDFEGCRALAEEAVARWRARYGDDDALMLDTAEVLTNVLYARGRPKQTAEAARLSEEILRGLRTTRGQDHLAILLTAGRLGGGHGLRHQGDFASACDLDDAIWKRTEQRYNTDHPKALHAAARAATGLYLLGRFHEARELDAMVLDRLQPNNSADILQATHHLARDLHALGRYEDALRQYEAVLDQALDVLGRDHALVLHAQRAQAGTLRKAGRLTDAARLADQALDGHLRRFGHDHPATLAAKVTAALAGTSAGAPGLGRVLAEEALEGYRRTLGEDHPFTSACAIDLAVVMRAVGDVQGALNLDRNALAALREGGRLGHDHFYALCGATGMATDLYLLDELRAAHGLMSGTLDGFQSRHGPNHPYTLACVHDLAVITRASSTGRDGLRGLLGEHHPEVRAAARDELLDCDIDIPPL